MIFGDYWWLSWLLVIIVIIGDYWWLLVIIAFHTPPRLRHCAVFTTRDRSETLTRVTLYLADKAPHRQFMSRSASDHYFADIIATNKTARKNPQHMRDWPQTNAGNPPKVISVPIYVRHGLQNRSLNDDINISIPSQKVEQNQILKGNNRVRCRWHGLYKSLRGEGSYGVAYCMALRK